MGLSRNPSSEGIPILIIQESLIQGDSYSYITIQESLIRGNSYSYITIQESLIRGNSLFCIPHPESPRALWSSAGLRRSLLLGVSSWESPPGERMSFGGIDFPRICSVRWVGDDVLDICPGHMS